ncbi:MAG: hypothetical protein AAF311_09655 [Pseudomonadota bacterium]
MNMDKAERALGLVGRGFSLLTTLACIALAGVVSYFVLRVYGLSGAGLWTLTLVGALVGGAILKIVLNVMLRISEF